MGAIHALTSLLSQLTPDWLIVFNRKNFAFAVPG